eukprot:7829812-Alexandrium_andersonii.AAC.1
MHPYIARCPGGGMRSAMPEVVIVAREEASPMAVADLIQMRARGRGLLRPALAKMAQTMTMTAR